MTLREANPILDATLVDRQLSVTGRRIDYLRAATPPLTSTLSFTHVRFQAVNDWVVLPVRTPDQAGIAGWTLLDLLQVASAWVKAVADTTPNEAPDDTLSRAWRQLIVAGELEIDRRHSGSDGPLGSVRWLQTAPIAAVAVPGGQGFCYAPTILAPSGCLEMDQPLLVAHRMATERPAAAATHDGTYAIGRRRLERALGHVQDCMVRYREVVAAR